MSNNQYPPLLVVTMYRCYRNSLRSSDYFVRRNSFDTLVILNPRPKEIIRKIRCHSAEPFGAYELPHRREIVSGAVF